MMNEAEMIKRMEKERELVNELAGHLKKEVECIVGDDVEALEESLPVKQEILTRISANREGMGLTDSDPEPEIAVHLRCLQRDLVGLWKKVDGFNELTKDLVSSKLADVQSQLEPFFAGMENGGYDSRGKKSRISHHTIKAGV